MFVRKATLLEVAAKRDGSFAKAMEKMRKKKRKKRKMMQKKTKRKRKKRKRTTRLGPQSGPLLSSPPWSRICDTR